MGKFTTGILLFFSFMILFTSEYASAACWNMIKGKKVPGPVTVCESPAACRGAGGYWGNGACSATPANTEIPKVEVNGSKSKEPVSSCTADGGNIVKTKYTDPEDGQEYTKSTCYCNNQELPIGQKCDNQTASFSKNCTQRGGEVRQDGCFCDATWKLMGTEETCGETAAASTGGMSLDQCIAKFTARADLCDKDAKKAVDGCNQEKAGDSTIGMGKDIVNMAGEVYKAKKAQEAKATGVDYSSSCAMTGLTLFTVLKGMDAFKGNCDTQYSDCEKSCDDVTAAVKNKQLTKDCKQFAQIVPATGGYSPIDLQKIADAETDLEKTVTASTKSCKVTAKGEQSMLADALTGYSNSATQAKVCECQKVAGSATCANVPSAADCLVGGSQYGSTACLAYGDCAIGTANYSSVSCQCSRDSTLAVCKTAAAAPVSNFSGIDSKAGSTTAAGLPASAGSTGADGLGDLGSFSQQKAASDTKDAAATANPGLTTGGGGGGGGGGSAPGADVGAPAAAAGEPEGGAGSGGVFGQIKSMFGMGGGSSSKTGSAASKTGAKDNPDLAKWLKGQKRCMASVDECKQVNPANKEIFDIMKDRYNKLSVPLDPYLK